MKITETLLNYTNNRRGDRKLLELNLVLNESECAVFSDAIPALAEQLHTRLALAGIARELQPDFKRHVMDEPTAAFAGLYCDLALLLQQAAGHRVSAKGVIPDGIGNGVWAWFEFEHDDLASRVAALALNLIIKLAPELDGCSVSNEDFDEFEEDLRIESAGDIKEFQRAARRLGFPGDAAAIMNVASRLDIPCVRLDQDPFQGFTSLFRDSPGRLLKLGHGRHQQIVDGTFCIDRCEALLPKIKDREALRKYLLDAGLPVPPRDPSTLNCMMTKRALRAASHIGFPVVVKPGRREHGNGVSTGLESNEELRAAVENARKVSNVVLVEGMIAGDSNRLLITNHRVIGLLRAGAEHSADSIHPSTVALAENLSRQLDVGILVLDLVTSDISKPLEGTHGAAVDLDIAPELDELLALDSSLMEQAAEAFLHWMYPEHQQSRTPIVTVTGTNGKTTTTRMIARIMQQAGHCTGMHCSDGVYVGEEFKGGNSEWGAGSHFHILSSPEVDFAVFEEWFGRICRAGFAYSHSDVSVCLNVTDDHLGRIGVHTLEQMAGVKEAVVARAREGVVLNAEDPHCLAMAPRMTARNICLVSSVRTNVPPALEHSSQKLYQCVIEPIENEDWIVLHGGGRRQPIIAVNDIPATFDGAASFNTSNAMHAAAACYLAGASAEVIRQALQSFSMDFRSTPGRLNVFEGLPYRVVLDYAHNPDGFRRFAEFVDRQECSGRKIVMAGVPGDRRDEEFWSGAKALAGHYDHYVCRNFHNTRGRPQTEIPELLKAGLLAEGVPEDIITIVPDASKAIDYCLDMAAAGDLIVLCIYDPEFDPTWDKLETLSRVYPAQQGPDTHN